MSDSTATPSPTIPSEIEVKVGDETFYFRVPSPRDVARLGTRAQALRRADEPGTNGSEIGLDGLSADLYRGFALFETLLIRADTDGNWPFSKDDEGKPYVDSTKFPTFSTLVVPEVYQGFSTALDKFLARPKRA